MTTKWSDPAVCFNGERPAEIPAGARVQLWSEGDSDAGWDTYSGGPRWEFASPDNPITYRYELPPVETEPFAVVYYNKGKVRSMYCRSLDDEDWIGRALACEGTVRFYDKHGNQVEPEALEEAGG